MKVSAIRRPLVVVAGQVPPPTGGQNVMIRRIVNELSADTGLRTIHLPFFFTPSFQSVRRVRLGKILELFAVGLRFLMLCARHGRPALLLYPSGGPQTVPAVRDILLLPFFCGLSRKVVVQFHAAGLADRLAARSGLVERVVSLAYRFVDGAIVMTDFNKRDPEALGIRRITVIPHRLPDENLEAVLPEYSACERGEGGRRKGEDDSASPRQSDFPGLEETEPTGPPLSGPPSSIPPLNLLYAGHLYHLKGTPQLVEAFAFAASAHPSARLILMGEFLPPYSEEACRQRCRELGIEDRVEITGVLAGKKKAARFRAAHLFVFPSVAPYESFGLVMAEAMMWGLPIVAAEWRGNRDVAGEAAWYCPAPDPDTLSQLGPVLASALSDPAKLQALAALSRKRYEEHFRLDGEGNDYRDAMAALLRDPA